MNNKTRQKCGKKKKKRSRQLMQIITEILNKTLENKISQYMIEK